MAATDVCVIDPHFKVVNLSPFGNDFSGLANDLATGLDTWANLHNQLTVKLYDAEHPPPNFPLTTVVKRQGIAGSTNVNRDLALCLSYWATDNRPRQRGRLYVPCCICAIGGSAAFASPANMQKVADLVPIFTGLGGLDVDWSVYSRADKVSRPITNWYVDNNWDTQRRRGPKPTARQTGTTTEGDIPNIVQLVTVPADTAPSPQPA